MTDAREAAWGAVHEALPARWHRGVPKPDGSRMDGLRRRLRFAYVQGAEDWTLENVGRRMTQDEFERVILRAP